METVLQCDCGFEASAANDVDLIARVQLHALEAHGMELSPDEVLRLLLLAEPAEDTS